MGMVTDTFPQRAVRDTFQRGLKLEQPAGVGVSNLVDKSVRPDQGFREAGRGAG